VSDKTTTLIVFTSPAEGREDDFNDWYDNVHLKEFVALPGVVSGQRFSLAPHSPKAATSYAAIYEVSVDPAQVLQAMDAAIKDGSMHMTDAVDLTSVSMSAWDPHGSPERHSGA
jgi:hypothetical protein